MTKTIFITGSTDGLGYEAAKELVQLGHTVLIHGRNKAKLAKVESDLQAIEDGGTVESYAADLADLKAVEQLATSITDRHDHLDVLINNAGVLKTGKPITADGHDVRFVVNTLAPYLFARRLLPIIDKAGRIINLSSAAQAPVNPAALTGQLHIRDDFEAYSQSKLAITMWSFAMAAELAPSGPLVVSLNPGSLLGTKMVKEGMGIPGKRIQIGSDIIVRAALSDTFEGHTGQYFDNDAGHFGPPHPDATDLGKSKAIVGLIEETIEKLI